LGLTQHIARKTMGCLQQPVIIRPQCIAAVVLRAREVQRVGRLEAKPGAKLSGLQVNRIGHCQGDEQFEQLGIDTLQDGIGALDWAD
jgi:hypothetical protein